MLPPSSRQQGDRDVESWLLAKVRRGPPPEAPELVAFQQESEAFLRQYHALRDALSGRFRLIRYVLSVYQRPPADWEAACAELRPDHAGLARAMLARLVEAPEQIRALLIANDRFMDAAKAATAVREARARMAGAPLAQQIAIAAAVPFPKLKGQLYLLSTFDATFKGDPVFGKLFPPIARAPHVRRPAPTTRLEAPPTTLAGKLQEGVDRLLKGRL